MAIRTKTLVFFESKVLNFSILMFFGLFSEIASDSVGCAETQGTRVAQGLDAQDPSQPQSAASTHNCLRESSSFTGLLHKDLCEDGN